MSEEYHTDKTAMISDGGYLLVLSDTIIDSCNNLDIVVYYCYRDSKLHITIDNHARACLFCACAVHNGHAVLAITSGKRKISGRADHVSV